MLHSQFFPSFRFPHFCESRSASTQVTAPVSKLSSSLNVSEFPLKPLHFTLSYYCALFTPRLQSPRRIFKTINLASSPVNRNICFDTQTTRHLPNSENNRCSLFLPLAFVSDLRLIFSLNFSFYIYHPHTIMHIHTLSFHSLEININLSQRLLPSYECSYF